MINNLINITGEYSMNFTHETKIVYLALWAISSPLPLYANTIVPVVREELTRLELDGKTDGVVNIEYDPNNITCNNQPTSTSVVKWVDQQSANDWITYISNLFPTYYSNISILGTSVVPITS